MLKSTGDEYMPYIYKKPQLWMYYTRAARNAGLRTIEEEYKENEREGWTKNDNKKNRRDITERRSGYKGNNSSRNRLQQIDGGVHRLISRKNSKIASGWIEVYFEGIKHTENDKKILLREKDKHFELSMCDINIDLQYIASQSILTINNKETKELSVRRSNEQNISNQKLTPEEINSKVTFFIRKNRKSMSLSIYNGKKDIHIHIPKQKNELPINSKNNKIKSNKKPTQPMFLEQYRQKAISYEKSRLYNLALTFYIKAAKVDGNYYDVERIRSTIYSKMNNKVGRSLRKIKTRRHAPGG